MTRSNISTQRYHDAQDAVISEAMGVPSMNPFRERSQDHPTFFNNPIDAMSYQSWWRIAKALDLSRVVGHGLPDTVDDRFLQTCFLYNNKAIAFNYIQAMFNAYGEVIRFDDDGMPTNLTADFDTRSTTPIPRVTKVVIYGKPDANHNYHDYAAIGDNGFYAELPRDSGVILWDTLSREPVYPTLDLIVKKLALVDSKITQNLIQQGNLPIVFTDGDGNIDPQVVLDAMHKGDGALIGVEGAEALKIVTVDLKVDFIAPALLDFRESLMNEMYMKLGVNYLPHEKKERMVVNEVTVNNEAISRIKDDTMRARELAAKELDQKLGWHGVEFEWVDYDNGDDSGLANDVTEEINDGN